MSPATRLRNIPEATRKAGVLRCRSGLAGSVTLARIVRQGGAAAVAAWGTRRSGLADDPHLRPIVGELLAALQAHDVMAGGGHPLPLRGGAGGSGGRGEGLRGAAVRALHGQKLQDSFDHRGVSLSLV